MSRASPCSIVVLLDLVLVLYIKITSSSLRKMADFVNIMSDEFQNFIVKYKKTAAFWR